MKTDIKSLPLDSIFNIVKDMGQPSFRAKQIFTWLHKFGVDSFDEMSNLPKVLAPIKFITLLYLIFRSLKNINEQRAVTRAII